MRHTTLKPKYRSLAELCALNRASYDALRGWLADLERIEAAPLDSKRDVGEQLDKRGQRVGRLLARVVALVPTATIPVADGRAVYVVLSRDGEWMVFQWLHGGPDGYVSPFGDLVAVPLETGKRLIGEAAR